MDFDHLAMQEGRVEGIICLTDAFNKVVAREGACLRSQAEL